MYACKCGCMRVFAHTQECVRVSARVCVSGCECACACASKCVSMRVCLLTSCIVRPHIKKTGAITLPNKNLLKSN